VVPYNHDNTKSLEPSVSKTVWAIVGIAIAVVTGVLVYWLSRSQPDCSFTGWNRTVGVELDVAVKDTEAVKAKLGIADSQVRQFDTLAKDFSLKYDTACRDVTAVPPRMNQGEFTCLRKNMTQGLDDLRKFVEAVEAAKTLTDTSAQKEIVLKALAALQAASSANYHTGCVSAMSVAPKAIDFVKNTVERSVQITNAGNNVFNFTVMDYPSGFDPRPAAGRLDPTATASVVLFRMPGPVPMTRPLTFRVHTTLDDDVEIQINIDDANVTLWPRVGEELRRRTDSVKPGNASVEDALRVVDSTLVSQTPASDANRYLWASTALAEIHQDAEATKALTVASEKNPAVLTWSSTFITRGVLANRQHDPDSALRYFTQAREAAPPTNAAAKTISDLFAGTVLLNQGNKADADKLLKSKDLQKAVANSPLLPSYVAKEVCLTTTCTSGLNELLYGKREFKS
jgi:hypothetical protein